MGPRPSHRLAMARRCRRRGYATSFSAKEGTTRTAGVDRRRPKSWRQARCSACPKEPPREPPPGMNTAPRIDPGYSATAQRSNAALRVLVSAGALFVGGPLREDLVEVGLELRHSAAAMRAGPWARCARRSCCCSRARVLHSSPAHGAAPHRTAGSAPPV
jgi:hypothetical protein